VIQEAERPTKWSAQASLDETSLATHGSLNETPCPHQQWTRSDSRLLNGEEVAAWMVEKVVVVGGYREE